MKQWLYNPEDSICFFANEYDFLSNFYSRIFYYGHSEFHTAEHAYQCEKANDYAESQAIKFAATPAKAKKLGQLCQKREDWDEVRRAVMAAILYQKFLQHKDLQTRLVATGDKTLVEGNWWGDTFWGACNYELVKEGEYLEGDNWLGIILMEIRSKFQ